ncbi:nitroreductase family protein [Candidatus Woesearchaeota archaeon]|nr:nitroreductase family protein [Candidatus Woesearchaeota archaeon]
MDTLECIATRRCIRKFLDIPVEFEKIGNIMDAGRYAPSAGNLQDWKFMLITDEAMRNEIAKACVEQFWIATAPVIILVCTEPEKTKRFYGRSGEKFSIQNSAAVVQNMLLAAHAEGLGACWVGAFEEEAIRRLLEIPDSVMVQAIVPIGYADEKVPVPLRFTLEDLIYIDAWGNRVKDLAAYMEWYGEHVQKAIKKGKEAVKKFIRRLQK